MKKILLFLFVFAATGLTYAQVTWSDDFESYSDGDMIGASSPDWRTWQNIANIDAPVSTEQASSGNNSLHVFAANATAAGPMDVFLPFPANYSTGVLHYEMMMFVQGSGAYFNFQSTTAEGTAWALNSTFNTADGNVTTPEGSSITSFPVGEWFKVEVDINLTLNDWALTINGDEVARWRNADNRAGGVNLYPLAGHDYFVDDVMYSHEPFTPRNLDLAVLGSKVPSLLLGTNDYKVTASVKNLGISNISSYDITWSDGVNSGTKSVTGSDLTLLEEEDVLFEQLYTASDANNVLTFTISNINGGADDLDDNNTKVTNHRIINPAPGKAVFVEEGTGTWCQWCPRGAVGMEYMANLYPKHFVGVAVHNRASDPMLNEEHDLGFRTTPVFSGGFPDANVERSIGVDPGASSLETQFFDFITETTIATITSDVEFDDATRTITAKVNATFKEDASGDYRLFAVISEDHVTGTSSGYAQVNAYAGGNNGEMGGYENLPSIVPASLMVYDDVSRGILGGFDGQEGSLPSTMTAGETYSYTFTYVVPDDQDPTQMGIAAAMLEPDGTVNNSSLTLYDDWASVSSVNNVESHEAFVGIAPNPFEDVTFIKLNLENSEKVSVEIYNNVGQLFLSQDYGQLVGKLSIPFNAYNLANGLYHAKINIGDQFVTRSIVVQ